MITAVLGKYGFHPHQEALRETQTETNPNVSERVGVHV